MKTTRTKTPKNEKQKAVQIVIDVHLAGCILETVAELATEGRLGITLRKTLALAEQRAAHQKMRAAMASVFKDMGL